MQFRILANLLFFFSIISLEICSGVTTTTKRQAPGNNNNNNNNKEVPVPAGDLLPPPELSKSFPTLRPVSEQVIHGLNPPPRDLVPPVKTRQPAPAPAPPQRQTRPKNPTPPSSTTEYPLLPPIEIPPEKPIDLAPSQTQTSFKETSFISTTGQGVPNNGGGELRDFTLVGRPQTESQQVFQGSPPDPNHPPPPSFENPQAGRGSNVIRFPDSEQQQPTSQPPTPICPSCECTSEVDYICANNGVVYLNSCAFDCATFCVDGLEKVELEQCASQNQAH